MNSIQTGRNKFTYKYLLICDDINKKYCSVVDIINDEDDELDIPRYLATAVVYYVKAKYAEDTGEMELKEYFMREFRALTEKFHAGKQKGPFRVQSFSMLT